MKKEAQILLALQFFIAFHIQAHREDVEFIKWSNYKTVLISVWMSPFKDSLPEILVSFKTTRILPLHSKMLIQKFFSHMALTLLCHWGNNQFAPNQGDITLQNDFIFVFLTEDMELCTSWRQDNQALHNARKLLLSR